MSTTEQVATHSIDSIIDQLDRYRQRATYGAVAAVLNRPPRNLMSGRARSQRESWIVSRNDGDKVVVEVTDTGVGIPTENLPKIFEPFFTTKEIGRGTGLGLAVCYGILTEHGGTLDVQSTVGSGTTFTITLSAVKLSEEQTG